MAYSKQRATTIVKNDVKYIPAGIIENVTLKSAKMEVSPNGNPFLEITFEKDGATLTQTEWEPTIGGFVTTEEQLQGKIDRQFSRMLQILNCYYSDSETDFNGETFKEFANWVAEMLNKADKTKKLRVKVVYNNKGYTTLPSYSKYTFIEPMELPEGQTSAIVALNIDTFVKPIVADNEEKKENPFNATTTSSEAVSTAFSSVNDDLPF